MAVLLHLTCALNAAARGKAHLHAAAPAHNAEPHALQIHTSRSAIVMLAVEQGASTS
jgi:hypothetical protein